MLAHQNSYDIPYDGNCMFSAVSYQLQANEFRQKVADHLEANAAFYCDFLCEPVSSESGYNADTEQPTVEDGYINSVSDNPQLQTELRHLRQEAWGDHITLQAIANMLSVVINVLSSNHPMFSVTPATICSAKCEIFVLWLA